MFIVEYFFIFYLSLFAYLTLNLKDKDKSVVKTRDGTVDKERNRNIWCRRENRDREFSLLKMP